MLKRKYVKKHNKWQRKLAPIKESTPAFTSAVAADASSKRNEGAQRRRYSEGKKPGPEWKRLKSGWQKTESTPKAYVPIVSYFKLERTQFDPEQFFKELEQETLADQANSAAEN